MLPKLRPMRLAQKPQPFDHPDWIFELKYDGFRAIVFVDGSDVVIQSRGSKPLGRYFPELTFAPGRYVLDMEVVDRAGHRDDRPTVGRSRIVFSVA